jgi:hypothetical protein
VYIALELCIATLAEVIEGPKITTRGTHHGGKAAVEPHIADSLGGMDWRLGIT